MNEMTTEYLVINYEGLRNSLKQNTKEVKQLNMEVYNKLNKIKELGMSGCEITRARETIRKELVRRLNITPNDDPRKIIDLFREYNILEDDEILTADDAVAEGLEEDDDDEEKAIVHSNNAHESRNTSKYIIGKDESKQYEENMVKSSETRSQPPNMDNSMELPAGSDYQYMKHDRSSSDGIDNNALFIPGGLQIVSGMNIVRGQKESLMSSQSPPHQLPPSHPPQFPLTQNQLPPSHPPQLPLTQNQLPPSLPPQLPLTQNQLPLIQNQLPHIQNQLPHIQNQLPHIQNQLPHIQNQLPHIQNQLPHIQNQLPHIQNQLPHIQNQLPHIQNQLPHIQNQLPHIQNQLPHIQNQLPHIQNQLPHIQNQLPHIQNQLPCIQNQLPLIQNQYLPPQQHYPSHPTQTQSQTPLPPQNQTTHAPPNQTTHAFPSQTTHAPPNQTTHAFPTQSSQAPSSQTYHAPPNQTTRAPTSQADTSTTTTSTLPAAGSLSISKVLCSSDVNDFLLLSNPRNHPTNNSELFNYEIPKKINGRSMDLGLKIRSKVNSNMNLILPNMNDVITLERIPFKINLTFDLELLCKLCGEKIQKVVYYTNQCNGCIYHHDCAIVVRYVIETNNLNECLTRFYSPSELCYPEAVCFAGNVIKQSLSNFQLNYPKKATSRRDGGTHFFNPKNIPQELIIDIIDTIKNDSITDLSCVMCGMDIKIGDHFYDFHGASEKLEERVQCCVHIGCAAVFRYFKANHLKSNGVLTCPRMFKGEQACITTKEYNGKKKLKQ